MIDFVAKPNATSNSGKCCGTRAIQALGNHHRRSSARERGRVLDLRLLLAHFSDGYDWFEPVFSKVLYGSLFKVFRGKSCHTRHTRHGGLEGI